MRSIAVVLVLAACTPDSLPLGEVQSAFTRADCEWQARCGRYGSVDECLAMQYSSRSRAIEAVEAGRTLYDGEAAAACLALYDALSCDLRDPYADTSVCADVYEGTLELGSNCTSDVECESGCCAGPFECEDACCTGTCQSPPPAEPDEPGDEGAPCYETSDCARALYCHDKQCVRRPGHGERCSYACALIGDVCDSTRRCNAARTLGESCTNDFDCASNLACSVDNVCVQWRWFADIGASCRGSYDCRSLRCEDNVCVDDPTCL